MDNEHSLETAKDYIKAGDVNKQYIYVIDTETEIKHNETIVNLLMIGLNKIKNKTMQYIIIQHYYRYCGNTNYSEKKLFSNTESAKNYILSESNNDFTEEETLTALTNEEDLDCKYRFGGDGFEIEFIELVG